jgi:tetratricopeptide (TPR) repeat protein
MRRFPTAAVVAVAVLVIAILAPARGRANGPIATGQHGAVVEGAIDAAFHEGMEAIYRGEPSVADRLADRLTESYPEDPRSWLLKARVLRLDVPDQNVKRDAIKSKSKPIHKVLERGEKAADALIEADANSLPGYLYRGWIRMFRAQLHALSNEYWSAGRRSKAGKSDLDFVLQRDPGNADALMLQGTYLYFADILPGLVKVAQFIVRFPGGNRDAGLRYLEGAALRQGYGRLDATALIGVILFGFEGRLEDGIEWFDAVVAEYPRNVRILEPLAAMDLYFTRRVDRDLPRLQNVVNHHTEGFEIWERTVAARLQLYVALKQMISGRLPLARTNLEALYADLPDEPDWLRADVLRALVALQLIQGDQEDAAAIVDLLPKKDLLKRKLRYATKEDAIPAVEERNLIQQLQPALRALYAGDPSAADRALRTQAPDSPFANFYRGEVELMRGRNEFALRHFQTLTEREPHPRWWLYQSLAHVRVAEIHAALGDNDAAQKSLRRMIDSHPVKDLLRHIARARKRYYENARPAHSGGEHAAKIPGAPPGRATPSR